MQKLRRFGFLCLHHGWPLLALALVLLATVVTLLRLGLPYAEGYKTDIEQLIADRYGAKVQIGQLSAGWQSSGPALLLQQVVVQDSSDQPMLQVGETRIRLDFWGSLTSLSLKAEHFELSGLKYQLDSQQLLQQKNGETVPSDEPLLSAVEQLLFRQLKNFTLVDSELRIKSEFTPDIVINIKRLAWRNEGKRHQGSGEVAINGITTNTSAFILDLYGDSLTKSRGQLYLSSSELDVLPWFEKLLPQSKKLSRADINFQAWGDIEQGALQQIQIALAQNRLVWRHEGKTEQMSLGQGQLLWRPTAQGWLLSSSALTLQSGEQSWHDLQLQLSHEQGVYSGALQQFQLSAMVPLTRLLAEDLSALQTILAFEADARLTQLALRLSDNGWFLGGDFIDLTSKPVADVPGFTGLNGHFTASKDYIRLDLTAQDGELRWGDAFSRATPYQQLTGQLEVLQQDNNWRLQIPRLALRHPELELDAEMVLELGDKAAMTLLAELRSVPVADAQHYFPVRHMPDSVINYLRPALISGNIPTARVLWQGAFADFPYRGGEGKFQALALVDNAEFSFDANWPDIKQMRAELLFENAAMLIQSQAGSLFELELNDGVTASIPDLFHADNLLIDIKTQTRAEGVTALMLASPLSGSVGATLDYLGVDGLVDAKVQLQIGLKEAGVIARGDVDFFANNLQIKAPAVAVEQVEGRLSFVNDQISSDQLKLVSQGIPLFASLKGAQQQDGYQLNLTAKGEHETGKLLALVAEPWQELGTGSAFFDWQLDISLPQTGFSYQSTVLIDLAAAELRLPEPFGKTPADGATVLIEAKGNQQGSDIILKYGDALQFLAKLDQDSGQISSALLSLGQASAQLKPGFEIELDLTKADFVPWLTLIQQQISSASDENNRILPPLSLVRGKVGELHLFDDVFLHNTNFSFVPAADHWLVELSATEAKGQLQLYHDLEKQGIKANLDRLALVFAEQDAKDLAAAELKAALLLDPDSTEKPDYAALEAAAFAKLTPMNWLADLPPLEVFCGQCTIGHFRLGELSLKSHSDGSGWILDEFKSNYLGHRWQFTGSWQQNELLGNSNFSGRLTSPAFGQLLSEYDISSSLTGSKATLEFTDIGWQGAPFQFNRHSLNGDFNWTFADGSLSEVSDGGARIFSLLSLDSLVRKLRLDFRDVFSKGFFFSKMSGTMTLTDGVSYTSNTEVLGAAGDIEMRGSADLKARQLDYQMSFSPKVTSSIPVILAWMVNPVSGVAAYALDEMFQSAEVISKINFTVTGDLDNPVVTEIKRDSKQITLPKPAATNPAPVLPVDPAAPVPFKRELLQNMNGEEKPQPLPLDGLRELPLMPEAAPLDEQDGNNAVDKAPADSKAAEKQSIDKQSIEKPPAENKRIDGV